MSKKEKAADLFHKAARRAVRKVGWDPRFDLEVREAEGPESMRTSSYGARAGRVQLAYSPDLLDRLAGIGEAESCKGLKNVAGRLEAVVTSRVYMSAGAYQICPFSSYDYAGILDAAADGLRSVGAGEAQIAEFTRALASFFIASVVAGVRAVAGPEPLTFRRGWVLDEIVSAPEDATLPRYAALHASIQLRLWSDEPQLAAAVRSRFPRPFDALEFETDRGVAILLDSFDMVGDDCDGLALADEAICELVLDQLKYSWRLWPIKAFQFSELLAPYVLDDQLERPNSQRQERQAGNTASRPSAEAEQRRAAVRAPGPSRRPSLSEEDVAQERVLPNAPTDPFAERFATDPQFRRRVLRSGIGRGISPVKNSLSFEALDALYCERATRVRLESETICGRDVALDIAYMSRQKLEQGAPDLSRINWGATRITPGGGLELYEKVLPITDATPGWTQIRGFPDLLFIVDSSGSMSWDPGTGMGQYDASLRAVYSVLSFLEEEKKAHHMKFAAVNFSGQTIKTRWMSYGELNAVKRLLFQYQGGGTVFDPASLDELVRCRADAFLCVMITDGQISNQAAVLESVRSAVSKGNGFVWIQIGRTTPLVEPLSQIGVPVHVVANHRDLEGLCLQHAKMTWGKGGT